MHAFIDTLERHTHDPSRRRPPVVPSRSRRHCHLHHTVEPPAEDAVGLVDVRELEAMRDERTEVEPATAHHVQKTAHPLLAARAKRRDDADVGQAGAERVVGDLQLARVDAEAGEHAARTEDAQGVFERRLRPERLIATSTSQTADLGDHIDLEVGKCERRGSPIDEEDADGRGNHAWRGTVYGSADRRH